MNRTIKDFGEQWQRYRGNEGFYGSLRLFEDILRPFLKPDQLRIAGLQRLEAAPEES